MTDPNDSMIQALLVERAGYLARGLDGRVALVDEQLVLRGYAANEATEAADAKATEADAEASDDANEADDQPEPVEPKRTAVESKPRRRA